jgi:hypothetical protein
MGRDRWKSKELPVAEYSARWWRVNCDEDIYGPNQLGAAHRGFLEDYIIYRVSSDSIYRMCN